MNIKLYKTLLATLCSLNFISTTASADVFDQVEQQKHLATTVYPTSAFDEAAAKDMLINGSAIVSGVLSFVEPIYLPEHRKAIDQREGLWFGGKKKRVLVANKKIVLYPDSGYLREYLKLAANSKRKTVASDQFLARSLAATSNQYGEFGFRGLKPGKYYIVTEDIVLKRQSNVMVPNQIIDNIHIKSNHTHQYDVYMSYGEFLEVKSSGQAMKVDARMMTRSTQSVN